MIKVIPKNSDIQLSKHIHSNEVDCKCKDELCNWTIYSPHLLELFEQLRAKLGDNIIHINSGFRCINHNLDVGGRRLSRHLAGLALDLKCPDWMKMSEFSSIAERGGFDTVIPYKKKRFIHVHLKE